ncbi:MAG: type IX secretion system membrane protein PorP/SprF [Marinilabiliaceae bacterium]|nr:type IX secretion system membrane protein PorP/SprF [Marinilabiliaceae bacterium]
MKKLILFALMLVVLLPLWGQKELYVSQYMHSRYSINSAFGGSAEALSVFAAYRKQWVGMNGAPSAQFFSAHTPLRNDRIALGVELFAQQHAMSHANGFTASYTYRVQTSANTQLGLSLNGGLAMTKAGWTDVSIKQANDPVFDAAESFALPVVGVGAAWYGEAFFAGVSVPNLFYNHPVVYDQTQFSPSDARYLITGGYLYQVTKQFGIQPSVLFNYQKESGMVSEAGLNLLFAQVLWLGGSYRTTRDVVIMGGVQVMPALRVVYSWDKSMNDMGGLTSGSHEVSLRYEFGVRLPVTNPRFF